MFMQGVIRGYATALLQLEKVGQGDLRGVKKLS